MITVEQERQLANLWAESVGHYMHKFAMTPKAWYAEAMQIATGIGLDKWPPLKILDIGTGFGYFQLACRALGHTAVGLDVPDDVIRRATDILGVSCVPHTIRAYQPLPAVLTDYDMITTFGVNFRHDSSTYWGSDEYTFLAADLRKRLPRHGPWLLRPNQTDDADSPIARLMDYDWWSKAAGPEALIFQTSREVQIRWQRPLT